MSEISEILRKMGLFGIGIITLTKEKVEELAQELVKKGELSQEEGKKFVTEVLSEKERQAGELEDKLNEKIKEIIKKMGIVTRGDIESLEKKIEDLEKKL